MKIKVPTKCVSFPDLVIEYVEVLNLDERGTLCGCFEALDSKISIGLSEHNTKDEIFATLFHEIHHLILYKSGITSVKPADVEEVIVTTTEINMFPLIQFKPSMFTDWVFVEIGEK